MPMIAWQAYISLLVSLFMFVCSASAGIFDDGNYRKPMRHLRAKPTEQLTDTERAVLGSQGKMGSIGLCGGKLGGNASLIRFRGRDAIVTNAHMFIEEKGEHKCEDISGKPSFFMPNTTFYDPTAPARDKDFVMRRVDIVYPPANGHLIADGFNTREADFAVFYLAEPISDDLLPNGQRRGFFRFSQKPVDNGIVMLGLAKDFSNGMDFAYQIDCPAFLQAGRFYHGCDTLKGSSGSLLAFLEDDELTFRGIHTAGSEDTLIPANKLRIIPNVGTSSDEVLKFMEKEAADPSDTFLAFDLQWLLSRAGCYSGKLDNQWGPGSKKALAAFASAASVTLPGTEPSAELLTTVEKVAPEDSKVCR